MKLSLNETWKRCLKMWKGVITILDLAEADPGCKGMDAVLAKEIWLRLNGYKSGTLLNDCFFCEYFGQHSLFTSVDPSNPGGCGKCPGTLVDPFFDCQSEDYHWLNEPRKFYKKLVRLNRKRKRS